MTKREIREHVVRLLFMREFHEPSELAEVNEMYFETFYPMKEEDKTLLLERYNKVVAQLPEIDVIIANSSTGWKLDRIGRSELTILRMATFEIRFDEEVPGKVAINEAVELGKLYGSNSAPAFINGILAKVI